MVCRGPEKNLQRAVDRSFCDAIIFAACNEMINPEVTFPPAKEFFYFPAKFIDKGNFFGSEIKSVGGNTIFFAINMISDQPEGDSA